MKIVRLTPPGRGAIATLLVEGPGAIDAIQARFHAAGCQTSAAWKSGHLIYGYFDFGAQSPEQIVLVRRGPESFELHCHGGHAAISALEKTLIDQGGHALAWQDWTAEHYDDPTVAAAAVALAKATTERTALILLDQFHGALGRAIGAIQRSLDRNQKQSAAEQLDILLAQAPLGCHLVEPWRVVLAGPPNVGKSSLVNALVGYNRAIVHPEPGTTRDVVSTMTAIEGWPVELSDTAGLRDRGHALERAGMTLAQRKSAAADLVILVFDLARPWSASDAALVEKHANAMRVHNKCDLPEAADPSRPPGLRTSALYGQGIDALLAAIAKRLVPEPPSPDAAVPFTAEQIEWLESIRGELGQAGNKLI